MKKQPGVKKPNSLLKTPQGSTGSSKAGVAKLPKDTASFLKQRMGKTIGQLQLQKGMAAADDPMSMEDVPVVPSNIHALAAAAVRRGDDFAATEEAIGGEEEEEFAWENTSREADNNRKQFFAELRKVLFESDIVIQVLDARDPGACRSERVEQEVLSAGKKLILLLNKIDLVPKPAVEAWVNHLKRSFPTIAFKAAHGDVKKPTHAMTSASRASEGLLRSTHAVIGADEVMQLLKNYSRSGGVKLKTHVTVGIVGYPNTGKSSVINSLKRHGAVETGGRAGVTKQMQEIKLDSKITLLDSPGVIFEGDSGDPSVALRNIVSVESVKDPVGVVGALLDKTPREAVMKFYSLERDFATVLEFLTHVAQIRGKVRRGGGLDIPVAAKSVIMDWTTGKFRYYVMPPVHALDDATPAAAEPAAAQVVNCLAPALDIDALLNGSTGAPMPSVLNAPIEDAQEPQGDDMDCAEGGANMVQVDLGSR